MKSELNPVENFLHITVWISACFYSLHKLIKAQTEIIEKDPNLLYFLRDLNPGWSFISRLKDDSDVEWSSWKFFIQNSWFYMLLQFIISECIRRKIIQLLKYWYIISSIIFIVIYMGAKQLIIIIAQPVIFAAIIFFGGRKIIVWLTSIALLAAYNFLKNKYYFWQFLDSNQDEQVFLLFFSVAWIELRCISFCLDYVDKKDELTRTKCKNQNQVLTWENIINMFSYVLYLPLLYLGPILLYEEFEKSFSVQCEKLSIRLKRFTLDMFLYQLYTILLDLSFHYIYFFAMQSNIEAIKKLPTLAICGGGLWMGLEFHVKYVISYGTTGAYARLDNIDPPPTPRCIARIHVYSQMWRYFDVGLYRFLIKYIYKPFYNIVSSFVSLSAMMHKLVSSLGTFLFIFMWHGTQWNIFVWSTLNYIGITIEYVGKALGHSARYKWFKKNVLRSDAMEVRFVGFLCAPLLGMSAISNFYLFAGSEVGDIYFGLLHWPSLHNLLMVYISLYCSCQVGMALQDVPSRTDIKRTVENKAVMNRGGSLCLKIGTK